MRKMRGKGCHICGWWKTPLCARHFVEQEDEECLKARLLSGIGEYGKIMEPKEIQEEIKKQRPGLYREMREFFDV